jgi:surface protein
LLPCGKRQLIKDFLGALDNVSIRTAVKLWCKQRDMATDSYGHISLWDTHRVTDMSRLFHNQSSFNDDISGWDVSKVTTMREMFAGAVSFNHPIGQWYHQCHRYGGFILGSFSVQPAVGWVGRCVCEDYVVYVS